MNTAAIEKLDLIRKSSSRFGKEKIVVAIEERERLKRSSKFKAATEGGTKGTDVDAVRWAERCEDFGAGELLLTSIDRDGAQDGYDPDFTKAIQMLFQFSS